MKKAKKTSKEKVFLKAEVRKLFGKKLKRLREKGTLPANIFGAGFKSRSIEVNFKEFAKTYRLVRETGILYLQINKDELPTLINRVQVHPVSDLILHVDFRKVDLKKKIEASVPVKLLNQSEAVDKKGGVLLTIEESLLVEALPEDIPQSIEVDISILKEIGSEIKVSDLPKSPKYIFKTPLEKVVISIVEHKEEETTLEVSAPETEVAGEEEKKEGEEPREDKTDKKEEKESLKEKKETNDK